MNTSIYFDELKGYYLSIGSKIDRVHNELDIRLMNIKGVHIDLDTRIDRVSADFNQFSLDSMREIKSIHDTLHLMHDFGNSFFYFIIVLYVNCFN